MPKFPSTRYLPQFGRSDFNMIMTVLFALVLISGVTTCNSCVKRRNKLKHGFVEVPDNYPHKTFQSEEKSTNFKKKKEGLGYTKYYY